VSDCTHHAKSSALRFGGVPDDYIALHLWFDEPKGHVGNWTQRALRHHTFGIMEAIDHFGPWYTRDSDSKRVSTRLLCEQHLTEDLGFIPSLQDWFQHIDVQPWMASAARKLSRELPADA
jgi:hypothetical protein